MKQKTEKPPGQSLGGFSASGRIFRRECLFFCAFAKILT